MTFTIAPAAAAVADHAATVAPTTTYGPEPGAGQARHPRRRVLPSRVVGHVVLALTALFCIFPVYWLYATAFRPGTHALDATPFPVPFGLENFRTVFDQIPLWSMLGNTFVMALLVAVAQLVIAVLASYGFAMWAFPGKNLLFLFFVGSWLIPFQVTMIPNYLLISQMGLLGNVFGVVIPSMCSAFGVMLMRQHMQSFPRELMDAAKLDGRGSWSALWTVVVPNLRPAMAALGIMLFIEAWNNYLWPALIMQKQSDVLLQIGIRSFMGQEGDNWGAIMAASGIACLPIFVIYLFLSRYIQDAFVRSGLR